VSTFPPDPAGDAPAATQDWVAIRIAHEDATLYILIERAPSSIGFASTFDTNGTTGGYGCPQDQANRIHMLICADYAYNPVAYDSCRSVGEVIAHLAAMPAGQTALKDLVGAYPGMIGFECGTFGTGYNPVRQKYLRLALDLSLAGAYLEYLRDLPTRLGQELPSRIRGSRSDRPTALSLPRNRGAAGGDYARLGSGAVWPAPRPAAHTAGAQGLDRRPGGLGS